VDLGLTDQVVVVTGGAGGIGRDIGRAFAGEGSHVVVADLSDGTAGGLSPVESELSEIGPAALFVQTDVSDYDQCEALAAATVERFGRVDVLVNNAAWWPTPHTFFWDEQPADWSKMIDVIVRGTLNCSQTMGARMRAAGSGAIVNIVSDAAMKGESRETTYSAAKSAVVGLTRSLAVGLGPSGIRANCVAPGRTKTPLFDASRAEALAAGGETAAAYLDREKRALKLYPLRKFGTARDVANMVVALSSPAIAGHVTGQIVSVSGGYRIA
jgi:NAD(P)-dependent dehydrogenase (short-subunit alcohol dehydrogenase family)